MQAKSYAEIFAVNGAAYDKAMQSWPAARDQEFAHAVARLKLEEDAAVLDIPAGGGYLQRHLPQHCDYRGLDFSGGFVSSHSSGIDKCDENAFGLAAECVDAVVCLASLHHIKDRLGFYQECHRVLKPNGILLIGDVVKDSAQDSFLNEFVHRWNKLGHEGDFMQAKRDTAALRTCGFEANFEQADFNWCFDSKQNALEYCRLLFSLNLRPSDSDLQSALNVLGAYSTNPSYNLPWSLGFLSGIKD